MEKLLFEIINDKNIEDVNVKQKKSEEVNKSDEISQNTLFSKYKIILDEKNVAEAKVVENNDEVISETKPTLVTFVPTIVEQTEAKINRNEVFELRIKKQLNGVKLNRFVNLINQNLNELKLTKNDLQQDVNKNYLQEETQTNFETKIFKNFAKIKLNRFNNLIKHNLTKDITTDFNDPVLNAILEQLDTIKDLKTNLLSQEQIDFNKLQEIEEILDRNIKILEKN